MLIDCCIEQEVTSIMIFELTEENFVMYAMKNYDNPHCKGMTEFLDDLKRFKYIKRLLRKYNVGKDLKERLILNHIIVLTNLFGVEAATKMLFYKTEKKFWPQLKTFLVFLNFMPENVFLTKDVIIKSSDIALDHQIINVLRKV